MQLEHHVTSLELSGRLKKLGVPQYTSIWVWAQRKNPPALGGQYFNPDLFLNGDMESGLRPLCSAFLASELMKMLPVGFGLQKHEDGIAAFDFYQRIDRKHTTSGNPANSLAKALQRLIEQGIVDPKTLNA